MRGYQKQCLFIIIILLAIQLHAKVNSKNNHVQSTSLNHKKKQTSSCSQKSNSNFKSLEDTTDYLNQDLLEKSVDNVIDKNSCQKFRSTIVNAFDLLHNKKSLKKTYNCDQDNFAGTHSSYLRELDSVYTLRSNFKLICNPCSKKSSSSFVDIKSKTIQICEANLTNKKRDLTKQIAKQIEYAFLQITDTPSQKNKIIDFQKKCSVLNTDEKYSVGNIAIKNKGSAQPFFVIPDAETKHESIKAAHEMATKIPKSVRHQNEPDNKPIPEKSINHSKLLASNSNLDDNNRFLNSQSKTDNTSKWRYENPENQGSSIQEESSSSSFNHSNNFNRRSRHSETNNDNSNEPSTDLSQNMPLKKGTIRKPSSISDSNQKNYVPSAEKDDNSLIGQNSQNNPKKNSYNSTSTSSGTPKNQHREVTESSNENENSKLTDNQKTIEDNVVSNSPNSSISIPMVNLGIPKGKSIIGTSDGPSYSSNPDKIKNGSEIEQKNSNKKNIAAATSDEDNHSNNTTLTQVDSFVIPNNREESKIHGQHNTNRTPQNDKANQNSNLSETDLKYLSGSKLTARTKKSNKNTALSINSVLDNLDHYNITNLKQIFTENPNLISELKINHIAIGFLNSSNEYYAIGDTAQPKKIYKEISGKLILTRDLADQ